MKKTVSAHVYNTIERYPQILKTPKVEKAMGNLKCWMALRVNRGFDNSSCGLQPVSSDVFTGRGPSNIANHIVRRTSHFWTGRVVDTCAYEGYFIPKGKTGGLSKCYSRCQNKNDWVNYQLYAVDVFFFFGGGGGCFLWGHLGSEKGSCVVCFFHRASLNLILNLMGTMTLMHTERAIF